MNTLRTHCSFSVVVLIAALSVYAPKSFAQSASTPVADTDSGTKKLSCSELKQKIEDKLQGKGVKNFKLDVIDKSESSTAKIVGSCDGGTHKIT